MQYRRLATAFVALVITAVATADGFAQTRIRFAPGRTSASVTGSLSGGATRRFVLGARDGQYLSGNVSSKNGCVKFVGGSTAIDFMTVAGNNFVTITNSCRSSTSFILTVSINSAGN
ncbi:MAG: hypothetical protein IPO41_01615 [Acidobacteria bacterium]|nr:hypothetical protein [Acidobacteriota bacterium]MBK9527032.1 hypothetical protein [Acidobacteriota bacterium]MBP9111005.1 hypothetical protein [Pyrinomonadaceae bacterium]